MDRMLDSAAQHARARLLNSLLVCLSYILSVTPTPSTVRRTLPTPMHSALLADANIAEPSQYVSTKMSGNSHYTHINNELTNSAVLSGLLVRT